MKLIRVLLWAIWSLVFTLTALPGLAADYPAPMEGSWVVHDFRFHTGEVLPELRLHYTTVGVPAGEPALILHGTTQSGASMLTPAFAGELFGPGQALDASHYYIILPDAIGTGQSSKPSDGLRASFPQYNYDDMVEAQYRLVTEHLGVRHLRLVLGFSMGGMHTWMVGSRTGAPAGGGGLPRALFRSVRWVHRSTLATCPAPATSHAACGSPARRAPAHVTTRVM